jgi:hypothetical protein
MKNTNKLSYNWCTLQQECLFVTSNLDKGLSGITKVIFDNLDSHTHLYQAFFYLSIGLERLFKICIAQNNSSDSLQKYGHDIQKLYTQIIVLHQQKNVVINCDKIDQSIISFITYFASSHGRYYNFNKLYKNNQTHKSPMEEFCLILDDLKLFTTQSYEDLCYDVKWRIFKIVQNAIQLFKRDDQYDIFYDEIFRRYIYLNKKSIMRKRYFKNMQAGSIQ